MDIDKLTQNKYRALLRASAGIIKGKEDQKKIRKAMDVLMHCLEDSKTLSGESAALHALSIARIVVSEMGLGMSSLIGSLLSNCAGELPMSGKEIKKEFGSNTLKILQGLKSINNIETAHSSYQAENFLKLVLSLADDIRVILIKLAERLEYMRRLNDEAKDIGLKVSSETYFLYAPLAHRLGLYQLKSEMEDRAMMHIDPEAYNMIESKLKQTTASRNKLIRNFSGPVREVLDKTKIKYLIKGRTKSIHSIWQKMKRQDVEFEEVYDLFAIRIIIDSKAETEKSDCWQVYSFVTDIYQPNPSRLRDWISAPKSNGYESLHTTVMGPGGKWVEVQIRSSRMDEIAEKGLAAHYKYKGIGDDSSLNDLLLHMREILDEVHSEEETIIDQVKSGLYTDEVFVFTPKGDLKRLPAGATILDFAFEIHTQVGATCVGGKINGRNVGLKQILQNGDQVSVLTSKNQKPKQDWLSITVTGKARNRIRQALNEEKVKAAAEGKEILTRRMKNWKIDFDDVQMNNLINHFKLPNARELYYQIQNEKIDLSDIKDYLTKKEKETGKPKVAHEVIQEAPAKDLSEGKEKFGDYLIIENRVKGLDYKLSKCCNPVLGDKIFGFVTITEGVKIHRVNCPNAAYMISNYPYRILMARWTTGEGSPAFQTGIRITGIDDHAMISKIHDVLSAYKVTLRNFNYENHDGMFEGVIHLFVSNINTLNGLIKKLLSIQGVMKASRYD